MRPLFLAAVVFLSGCVPGMTAKEARLVSEALKASDDAWKAQLALDEKLIDRAMDHEKRIKALERGRQPMRMPKSDVPEGFLDGPFRMNEDGDLELCLHGKCEAYKDTQEIR